MNYKRSKFTNNKYSAQKTICPLTNYKYDSKLEATYGYNLELLLRAGKIVSYIRQKALELNIYNASGEAFLWRKYKIDFVVDTGDCVEYIEVKGYPTPEWKQKWDITEHIFFDLLADKSKNAKLVLVTGSATRMQRKVVKSYYC